MVLRLERIFPDQPTPVEYRSGLADAARRQGRRRLAGGSPTAASLTQDSPLRRRFREGFARPAKEALGSLLQAEREHGHLRSDLDIPVANLSLVGMSVSPLLVHPVRGELFDYRLDAAFRDRLFQHTRRLFLDGARAPYPTSTSRLSCSSSPAWAWAS